MIPKLGCLDRSQLEILVEVAPEEDLQVLVFGSSGERASERAQEREGGQYAGKETIHIEVVSGCGK